MVCGKHNKERKARKSLRPHYKMIKQEKELRNEGKKKKLLLVDMYPHTSLAYKLLFFLKDYFKITLILLRAKDEGNLSLENYEEMGVNVHYFDIKKKKVEFARFILKLLKERLKNYDYVLGKSGPNWPTYLVFKIFNSSKKIYFPYDVFLFLWKEKNRRPKTGIFFEKSNFKRADFIIHKGPGSQLKLLEKDGLKNLQEKTIQFFPCLDNWIVPLNKKKTKKISIVYLGVAPKDDPLFRISWGDVFKQIVKQGIEVHVYPLKMSEIQKFEKLSDKNIFYHKPVSNKILNKEISRYHYGLASGAFFDEKIVDGRMLKTAIGNKFLSCLEAGIPIMVDETVKFPAYLVKKYNCGIIVPEKDLPNLRKILEKQNYSELLKGVERARESMRLSKQKKRLVKELKIENK